jgi:hypothetical protein
VGLALRTGVADEAVANPRNGGDPFLPVRGRAECLAEGPRSAR